MILVAGATGLVGGMITRRLVDQGRQVRIVVRPGSSYDALVQAGAEPVFADLTDRDSLDRACAGAEAVITTATASSRPGQETVEAVDRAGNANLVSVAAASGVQRFVLVSTLGADPASPVEIFRAKGEAEQRLQETAMRWTALRPNMMMEIWVPLVVGGPVLAHRPVHLVGGGQRRHSLVSARDVAAYAVASLDHPDADRRVLVLGGPAAVTWRDVVAAFEAELGHAIDVRTVEPGEPVPGVRDFVVGLMVATESYDSPIDMAGPSARFGIEPTPLSQFVHELCAGVSRPSMPAGYGGGTDRRDDAADPRQRPKNLALPAKVLRTQQISARGEGRPCAREVLVTTG